MNPDDKKTPSPGQPRSSQSSPPQSESIIPPPLPTIPGASEPKKPAPSPGVGPSKLPISTSGEAAIRIPSNIAPETPAPGSYRAAARARAQAEGSAEKASDSALEIGRPQLRSNDLKLEAPVAPAASKPPTLVAPRSRGSIWFVRGGLLAGLALALGLLYWSVFVRLLPISSEHRQKAIEMTRLTDDLERLRNRYTPQEIAETRQHYQRAEQALFSTGQELSDWQTQVQNEARMGVLEAKLKVEEAQKVPAATDDLSTIAVQITVSPDPVLGSAAPAYARLLKFTEAIANNPKRLDLVELSVRGDSNSVSQAQATVQLYATERKAL